MEKRFVFGWLAELFTKLHFRYEVRAMARSYGFDRGEIRHLSGARLQYLFDAAWPDPRGNGETKG